MLYHLLYPWHETYGFLNVFKYITFRTIYASVTALAICLLMGPWFIQRLTRRRIGQSIREDGPATHKSKAGTPTMGGSLIILGLAAASLLWANLGNRFVLLALGVTLGYGAIGFVDDRRKLLGHSSKGLSGKRKLQWQFAIAAVVAILLFVMGSYDGHLSIPFLKDVRPNLGVLYIPFAMLVIVGASNAVNLTDGLDGLAIGPVITSSATYLVFAYLTGNRKTADYLQIPFIPGTGELAIFCGAMAGAGLGFLWWNTYPAQVFMGDTGSLALGAALGYAAVATKHEILLALVGGIFVAEAVSVIVQVASYKLRRKRVFLMSPVHHHFEQKGWPEPKIIVRFWIVSLILAMVAVSTLKLR